MKEKEEKSDLPGEQEDPNSNEKLRILEK